MTATLAGARDKGVKHTFFLSLFFFNFCKWVVTIVATSVKKTWKGYWSLVLIGVAPGQGRGSSRTEQVRGNSRGKRRRTSKAGLGAAETPQATYAAFSFIMNAIRIHWRVEHRVEEKTPDSEDLGLCTQVDILKSQVALGRSFDLPRLRPLICERTIWIGSRPELEGTWEICFILFGFSPAPS